MVLLYQGNLKKILNFDQKMIFFSPFKVNLTLRQRMHCIFIFLMKKERLKTIIETLQMPHKDNKKFMINETPGLIVFTINLGYRISHIAS